MDKVYENAINAWNEIFAAKSSDLPTKPSTGIEAFDDGLAWLCEGSDRILDFGCGDGTLLFMCALQGTQFHVGIDLSEKAIEKANSRKEKFRQGVFDFIWGGVEQLKTIESDSLDAVILSNIIDNLYPQDMELVLQEVHRILKESGKALVKLNPFITKDQIEEWDIKIIEDDLLDDGFVLLNKTDQAWRAILTQYFVIHEETEIVYTEQKQTNRMFLLVKENGE